MLTLVWNPRPFPLMNILENGRKFNTISYRAEIISPLSEWRSIGADPNERKRIVYADNERPRAATVLTQFFEGNQMKPVRHPLYLPDLAPLDVYLLGHIKRCLIGLSSEGAEQLFEVIRVVLEGITK
jgi:hypothetical protein